MTRGPSTNFGHSLGAESKRLVEELRKRTENIPKNYDTDFNLYRWIMDAERRHRSAQDILESAHKGLSNHLRYRLALELDNGCVPNWEENPIFKRRLMPKGQILSKTDAQNRLLWFIEYESINVEALARTTSTSALCRYQFWQFEVMLQHVIEQEKKTGRLSALRHVVDMSGYEINPFTMLFVSSGMLAYYSQLFHFEHYPELVSPAEMVNISKWIHVPYRLAKTMMPTSFADRFRLHDDHFLQTLLKDMTLEDIPRTLGGKAELKCLPAKINPLTDFWQPTNENEILQQRQGLTTAKDAHVLTVHARRRKIMEIHIGQPNSTICWHFHTDGEVHFGVYHDNHKIRDISPTKSNNKPLQVDLQTKQQKDFEAMSMCYPWLKLAAKIVPEQDQLQCIEPGTYFLVFCNKQSWFGRRTIKLTLRVQEDSSEKIQKLTEIDGGKAQIERTLSL